MAELNAVDATPDKLDDLDRYVAKRGQASPTFLQLYGAAIRERELLRTLAARRVQIGLSQREVAARMRTSQAAIARFERGETDPRLSTIERFAAAIGQRVEWKIVDDGRPQLDGVVE